MCNISVIYSPIVSCRVCQREEEERKDEERRRASEERRRLEKERILKERRDAEERDRKMDEKLQMIEEQRLEQCLSADNSALQWRCDLIAWKNKVDSLNE